MKMFRLILHMYILTSYGSPYFSFQIRRSNLGGARWFFIKNI
jgi:hypothetical protein